MVSPVRSGEGGQSSGTMEFVVGASSATHIHDSSERVAR